MSLRTTEHFSHDHLLTKINDTTVHYNCDGCKMDGKGITYRCNPCNYDLHEFCATCPLTLTSFLHPQHELALYIRNKQSTPENNRICDICNESIEGYFYRCQLCNFDLHPLCTQLPQHMKHELHPHHNLELRFGRASMCNVCESPCKSWRYGCELCKFYLHENCATTPLTLRFFLHPQHELTLAVCNKQSKRENNRICNFCNDSIEGLFYKCKLCDFNVHSLCTQLPQHVKHVLHPAHPLEFRLRGASTCKVCHAQCDQSWRYGCDLCRFDIHLECLSATSLSDHTKASGTKSKGPNTSARAGQDPTPSNKMETVMEVGEFILEVCSFICDLFM